MNSPSRAQWVPALSWLRNYDWSWLRGDVLAGITLAAYLLPAALGDASLANVVEQKCTDNCEL
jgi:sulfate permease, SulP family